MLARRRSRGGVTPQQVRKALVAVSRGAKSMHKNFKANAGGSKYGISLSKMAKGSKRTSSKRKNLQNVELVDTESGGLSKSRYSLTYKKMKSINTKNCTKDINRTMTSGGALSLINRQAAVSVSYLGTSESIIQLWASSIATDVNFQNAASVTPASTDKKFWCDYQRQKITFTNQGPSLMKFVIYDCLCKVDNCASPEASWDLGLQRQGGINNVDEHTYHPGSSPLDSKIFRTNWKILNKKRIALATGGNHEHSVFHSYNGLYNYAKAYEFNVLTPNAPRNIRGHTIVTMIAQHGMPGDDQKVGTTVGVVGLAPTKLIWCVERSYQTRIVDIKSTHTAYGNALQVPVNLWQQNPDGQGVHNTITNIVEAVTANA